MKGRAGIIVTDLAYSAVAPRSSPVGAENRAGLNQAANVVDLLGEGKLRERTDLPDDVIQRTGTVLVRESTKGLASIHNRRKRWQHPPPWAKALVINRQP